MLQLWSLWHLKNYLTQYNFIYLIITNIFKDWEQNGIPTLIIREITVLKELQHPNII